MRSIAAARLAGVEERAVDQFSAIVTSRSAVGPHIGRILAAELEAGADEPLRRARAARRGRRGPNR